MSSTTNNDKQKKCLTFKFSTPTLNSQFPIPKSFSDKIITTYILLYQPLLPPRSILFLWFWIIINKLYFYSSTNQLAEHFNTLSSVENLNPFIYIYIHWRQDIKPWNQLYRHFKLIVVYYFIIRHSYIISHWLSFPDQ